MKIRFILVTLKSNIFSLLSLPKSDKSEEIIGAEVLDIDIDQTAAAPINGVAAHLLHVVRKFIVEILIIAHVDSAPHQRVLEHCAPFHAHLLNGLQDIDRSQPREYGRRDFVREFGPVSEVSLLGPGGSR